MFSNDLLTFSNFVWVTTAFDMHIAVLFPKQTRIHNCRSSIWNYIRFPKVWGTLRIIRKIIFAFYLSFSFCYVPTRHTFHTVLYLYIYIYWKKVTDIREVREVRSTSRISQLERNDRVVFYFYFFLFVQSVLTGLSQKNTATNLANWPFVIHNAHNGT